MNLASPLTPLNIKEITCFSVFWEPTYRIQAVFIYLNTKQAKHLQLFIKTPLNVFIHTAQPATHLRVGDLKCCVEIFELRGGVLGVYACLSSGFV